MRSAEVRITPIAIPDVSLINTKGMHQKVFLRAVIEVVIGTGLDGLGEMRRATNPGVPMHSNAHLGISLAALCHVAAASPNLSYDRDTHYPRYDREITKKGRRSACALHRRDDRRPRRYRRDVEIHTHL